MKPSIWLALTALTSVCLSIPVRAENIEHTQQLVTTRECQRCDLREVGLVYARLSGADLQGADLSFANLSRIELSNANLSGANLAGAVLFSADLRGANLRGADLRGADLRGAQLDGAILDDANLDGANLLGAVGLPADRFTAEDLYTWGLAEAQRGNFRGAIAYYNEALTLKPDFAHALLARGISRFRLSDPEGALNDAKQAETLFMTQGNEQGHLVATRFTEGIVAMQEAEEEEDNAGGSNFTNFLGSLGSLLLRFLF